jgi:hypothetical protein
MDKCYVVWSDYDGEIVAISDSLDSAFGIAKLHFISQEVGDIDKIDEEEIKEYQSLFEIEWIEEESCWVILFQDELVNIEIREEKFNQPLTRTY